MRAEPWPFSKTARSALLLQQRSEDNETVQILKMGERPDWTLLRTVAGLQQMAGVPVEWLRRLVIKELADNALDAGNLVACGEHSDEEGDAYHVEDDGPGLDGTPEEIADLFSIRRPMRSSKLLRLPRRGALGNGLRIVAGAVLASEGRLSVATRDRWIRLAPQFDGSTRVVAVELAEQPIGTRVEVGLGPALPEDEEAPTWGYWAARAALAGKRYEGRSSPFWYDAVVFHELVVAHGEQPLRALVAELDGCSGGKAGLIIAAAGLDRRACGSLDREEAERLLLRAQAWARPVSAERLGSLGREAFSDGYAYAVERSMAEIGSVDIPFVAEVWARKCAEKGAPELTMLINRTPAPGTIYIHRDGEKHIEIMGCGLYHAFPDTPTTGAYRITVNITTPYCPITSGGKAPSLRPFVDVLGDALSVALRKAQRASPKQRGATQKDVILANLDAVIAEVSGNGRYRFNERQILYKMRPIVFAELDGAVLKEANFKTIITDYENEHGEIEGMYREPRGSIYHPHRGDDTPLGTLMVEAYERPVWTYNKLVYIEKEGFKEALKAVSWPERHDCMLMSSKGYTTRAAKDLVDMLAVHDEPVMIFTAHDADAAGTMIYQTFQEATRERGARKVRIVNLGLEPWEAIAMGLEVEEVEAGDKRKPVADYVLDRTDGVSWNEARKKWEVVEEGGEPWEEWLQTHRIELNAMSTPQFIDWLDRKMVEHGIGKLTPPHDVILCELNEALAERLRTEIVARILREADAEGQIAEAMRKVKRPSAASLARKIEKLAESEPEKEWRAAIEEAAQSLLKPAPRHRR
jgi:hypothetical protein